MPYTFSKIFIVQQLLNLYYPLKLFCEYNAEFMLLEPFFIKPLREGSVALHDSSTTVQLDM